MSGKPVLTTAALAVLAVGAYLAIADLPRRNGLGDKLNELQNLPGWPLPDALDQPGLTKFTGYASVDHILAVLVRFFYPCVNGEHPTLSLLSVLFCGQVLSLHTVLIFEGLRRGNKNTVLWPSSVWAQIYQFIPVGLIAPVWSIVQLWKSPVSRLAAQSAAQKAELVTMDAAKLSVYPFCLIMGFIVPTALVGWPDLLGFGTRQIVIALWQFFPFWVALWQFDIMVFVSAYDLVPPTATSAGNPRYANRAYAAILALAAATHITTLAYIVFPEQLHGLFPGLDVSSITVAGTLIPNPVSNPVQIKHLAEGVLTLLQYDMYFSTGSLLLWSLYQTYSLENDVSAALSAAVKSVYRTVLVGPAGAALWNIWDRDTRARKIAAAVDPKKNE